MPTEETPAQKEPTQERSFAAAPHHSPSAPAVIGNRLVSLDVFRGITIAAMILVNDPGSWGHIYWPLSTLSGTAGRRPTSFFRSFCLSSAWR